MADSVIESLIGDAPSGVDQIKALANELRRRQSFAEIGLMSGDKALKDFGTNVLSNDKADELQLGNRRDKATDDLRQDSQFQNLMKHQGDSLAQQMEIARMNDARMREIAALNAQTRLDAVKDRQSNALDKQNESNLIKFANKLDSSGYSELFQSMNDLNGMVNKYTDDKGNRKDIPGIGGAHNTPILGAIADAFGSGSYQEAQDNKSVIAAVRNAILKARSGGAVTPQEADRMLQELQLTTTSNQANFVAGVKRLTNRMNSRLQSVFTGASPEVLDAYYSRGGTVKPTLSPVVDAQGDMPLEAPGSGATPTPTLPSGGAPNAAPAAPAAHTAPISGGGGAPYVRTGTRIRDGKKERIGLLPDGTIDVIGVIP